MVFSLIVFAAVAYLALLLPVATVIGRTLRGPVEASVREPYPAAPRVPTLTG